MRLTDLDEIARSTGYDVVEDSGWKTRGREYSRTPPVSVWHHTAGGPNGDAPSLNFIARSAQYAPLANYVIGRHAPGTIYVVAAGVSNNAGSGSWHGYSNNSDTVGIEIENTGTGEAFLNYDCCVALSAALIANLGQQLDNQCGHLEWADGRKIDPLEATFGPMDQFRKEVSEYGDTNPDQPVTGEDPMIVPVYSPNAKSKPNPDAGNRIPYFTYSKTGIIGENGASLAGDQGVGGWDFADQAKGYRLLNLTDVMGDDTINGLAWVNEDGKVVDKLSHNTHIYATCVSGATFGPYLST